jgi:rhodanese-related sulfurtransferase
LIICGSSPDFVQRAVLLSSSKFIGRIVSATNEDDRWVASVLDLGVSPYDEDALWDVVKKASRAPIDPLAPPPGSRGIDDILSEARAKLQRITASQALEELRESQVGAPTFLVDIRPQEEREREGGIHGSLIIERNDLEWRFDPRCASHLSIADRYDLRIIVFCQEGRTSSLAAYSLQQIGLLNATDIIGGYEAWKNAGLPIDLDRRDKTRSFISLAGTT